MGFRRLIASGELSIRSAVKRPVPIRCQNLPAGERRERLIETAAEDLLELLEGPTVHGQYMLLHPHRQLRIAVAEEIHGAARTYAHLSEQRGERAPQRVWSQLADHATAVLAEQSVGSSVHPSEDAPTDVVRRVTSAVASREDRGDALSLIAWRRKQPSE